MFTLLVTALVALQTPPMSEPAPPNSDLVRFPDAATCTQQLAFCEARLAWLRAEYQFLPTGMRPDNLSLGSSLWQGLEAERVRVEHVRYVWTQLRDCRQSERNYEHGFWGYYDLGALLWELQCWCGVARPEVPEGLWSESVLWWFGPGDPSQLRTLRFNLDWLRRALTAEQWDAGVMPQPLGE